jgi:ribose transport system substrate-binding protein
VKVYVGDNHALLREITNWGGAQTVTHRFDKGWPVLSAAAVLRTCRIGFATICSCVLAPTVVESRELKSISVLVADLGNPFFEEIGSGVESAAARLVGPAVNVTVRSSGYDLDRQIRQIDEAIEDGADLLIINAADTQRIGPAVLRARAAGMIVVAVDVQASGAQATVTSDNRAAGVLACNYLAHRLDGKGDILILDGPPVSSVAERVSGCREALSSFPEINILPDREDCGGSAEGGISCMTDALLRHPHLDAVFAINDPTAIGANFAAARAGRMEFFVVSIDGSPDGAKVLREPGTRLAATVMQNPRLMVETAVSLGIDLLAGKPAAEGTVETPVFLMTGDNVEKHAGWEQ